MRRANYSDYDTDSADPMEIEILSQRKGLNRRETKQAQSPASQTPSRVTRSSAKQKIPLNTKLSHETTEQRKLLHGGRQLVLAREAGDVFPAKNSSALV